uniref:Sterol 3-beta-glucosyltransferase UGT80B1 isoform X1 n=1 Tax=Rhizophora mucronata TaxID=61149 RepID=A0A2P2LDK1_RHIMU
MGCNGVDHPLRNSEGEGVTSSKHLGKGLKQTDSVDELVTEKHWSSEEPSEASSPQENEKQETISESGKRPLSAGNVPSKTLLPQRGLDHCITAPASTSRNSLADDHYDFTYYRSMTEKRTPRHELKLDRLSEHEKKKLLVELVKIQNDGTVEVDIAKSAPVASELLELHPVEGSSFHVDDLASEVKKPIPKLKICILVVGTRGDVQPFLAMAKRLQEFGHRVRLATHANFSSFVKSAGVEFYPLGGDPRVLAEYMARNKGLIPSGPGDISMQKKQLKAIIESLLPACTEPDLETSASFRAQAVIANPPAYGHVHVAESLGVPIHIFFTMPWTPTYEFPHPFARVPQTAGYWISYIIVDLLIWWTLRGYINDYRKKKLKIPPIAYFSMYYGSISHLPTGYMWSQHLVPKPSGKDVSFIFSLFTSQQVYNG